MAELQQGIPRRPYTLWELIGSDVAAWMRVWDANWTPDKGVPTRTALRLIWNYVGLRATVLYRLSQVMLNRGVKVLPQMIGRFNIVLYGLDIPPRTPIGPGLYIPHPVGTVVTAERIGANCTLVSGITIGMREGNRFPTLGDNVYVGAGARILGPLTIGDNARIGANAVVLKDVPADSTAVGVPAKILQNKPVLQLETTVEPRTERVA